jgi:hypothetical protein
MSLQEQHDTCDERVRAIDGVLAMAPIFANPALLIGEVETLRAHATTWTGTLLSRPDGSPDAVETSADALDDIATELDATAAEMQSRAVEVEAAMDAATGRAEAMRIRAFIGLADLEARGLRILTAGLRSYAAELDSAQSAIDRASSDAWSARGRAISFEGPSSADADWTDEECAAALRRIAAIYRSARTSLVSGRSALAGLIEAERQLGYVLGDAQGYARLSALPASTSTTALDAVLALADGVGDPDRAIISADEWAAYAAARDDLSAEERTRLDDALADARSPEERQVIISALASGAGLALTLALATTLKGMTQTQVREVAGIGLQDVTAADAARGAQLRAGGIDVIQQTGTTCGSASLLMLAAQRDPFLALLLAQGVFVDGHVPAYVADIPLIDRIPDAGLTTAERLEYLQTQIRIQTNKFTFWPGSALGSAPWGYGDEVSRILDDDVDMPFSLTGGYGDARTLVDDAIAAVDSGTPVPFLVGPDGVNVPRHYVLLVGHENGDLQFYEPGSGEVRSVPIADAVNGDGEWVGAFGGWTTIYGAAVPAT